MTDAEKIKLETIDELLKTAKIIVGKVGSDIIFIPAEETAATQNAEGYDGRREYKLSKKQDFEKIIAMAKQITACGGGNVTFSCVGGAENE